MAYNQKIQDAWNTRSIVRELGADKIAEGDALALQGKAEIDVGESQRKEGSGAYNKSAIGITALENKRAFAGEQLRNEGMKKIADGEILVARGNKLRAEGERLKAKAECDFCDVVITEFGNDCQVRRMSESSIHIKNWEYKKNGKPPESRDGKIVEIDGKKYLLTAVEEQPEQPKETK